MPLTVYLSQSLIMTFAPAGYVGLCFAVFAFQVLACTLWLRLVPIRAARVAMARADRPRCGYRRPEDYTHAARDG
jgi:hypothetical protein